MDGLTSLFVSQRGALIFFLMWSLSTGEDCQPFPEGAVVSDATDVVMPGDTIEFDFHLNWTFSDTVKKVVIDIAGTSLKFSHNDSVQSVAWQLGLGTDPFQDRNTSLVHMENPIDDNLHRITLEAVGPENGTLVGQYTMQVKDTASAGDLVQSELEVTVTHSDNSTCYTSVSSPSLHLLPPLIWLSDVSPEPLPMMKQLQGIVNVLLANPSSLAPSAFHVQTPVEVSSEEVILTLQDTNFTQQDGFTEDTKESLDENTPLSRNSSFGSFQCDIGELQLPLLQRDVVNGTGGPAHLGTQFQVRAEDYSQLHDGDVVNLTLGVAFGRGRSEGLDLITMGGPSLIWVTSIPTTLQVPPLHLKRPVLNLTIVQKSSCAYDAHTRVVIEINLVHDLTSTASAYNVTARVYLPMYMKYLRYSVGELRRNTMNLTNETHILYIHIERMTFSDPTTATLSLDVDLTDKHLLLADHHVITADAVYCDRWGNDTDMITAISYVELDLVRHCSQRVTWTTGELCTCSHDATRADCACCEEGACQCGSVNPSACQPCDQIDLCQEHYLEGWGSITELDAGDGKTTYVCDAHHRYKPYTKGISCYKRIHNVWHETRKVKQARVRRWAPPSQCWPERSEVSNASGLPLPLHLPFPLPFRCVRRERMSVGFGRTLLVQSMQHVGSVERIQCTSIQHVGSVERIQCTSIP